MQPRNHVHAILRLTDTHTPVGATLAVARNANDASNADIHERTGGKGRGEPCPYSVEYGGRVQIIGRQWLFGNLPIKG